ncbi:transmission trait enhancer LetE [Legionella yabuuchiae]|uniref:transmission trait enhancer LetE n=1 Tax=Legionella yabuuchiae TaxID=376727 RepID=UPI001055CC78|nr:transmission trait enhancer LetE [Legionella yabuuchiae]
MNTINEFVPYIKLKFNVEHPSFEACYAYGYECGLTNVSEENNPYKEGTREYEQWSDGWWAGFYKEEPIYDITDYIGYDHITEEFAANDERFYASAKTGFITKVLELSSVIAVSAILGYQVLDMVA